MHYFQFNIGDYASHTRHLDLIEDLAYRRLLDLYYLHERPLNTDATVVAKQIGMRDDAAAVREVLNEFFDLTPDGYRSSRADKEIEHYHSKIQQASRAGKASAERRLNGRSTDTSTDVQPTNKQEPINKNQEPITKNQKPKTQISVEPQSVSQPVVEVPVLGGKVYGVSQELVNEWSKAYPAVDVQAELQKMRVWAMSNPNMQKTSNGIPRFVNAWLSKAQNEAGKVPSGSFKNAGDRNAEVIRGLTRGLLGSGNNVKLLGS
jgi:uncharacterized protein YdaU (DUF1376 family)